VPGDPSQVVYVWIDALVNYLSGLGFGDGESWTSCWNEDTLKVHVIGKNVWKFHAVYWPAMLLSVGLPLPNHIVVHGFLTEEGRKISKSGQNAVDPFQCIDEYGATAVRYYLLRGASPFADSDFSTDRLKLLYNTDLANNLGNLVNRITTLCARAGVGGAATAAAPEAPEGYHDELRAYAFDRALAILWERVDSLNRDIDRVEPWKLLKYGQREGAHAHLARWLEETHRVAFWLSPFLPTAAEAILTAARRRPVTAAGRLLPRLP
jgi:methionyl-tRNA synthetase